MASDLKLEVQLGLTEKILGPLKRVRSGATDLGKALDATRNQVKALQAQQADVAGYRKASIEITKQGRQLKQLEETQRAYTSELDRQRTAHTNLQANLAGARTHYNKLAKALIEGKGESAEFSRELEKAQIKLMSAQQAFTRSAKSISTYKDRLRHAGDQHTQLSQRQRNAQERLAGLKRRLDEAGISTDGLSRKSREQRTALQQLNAVYDQQKQKLKQVGVLQKRNQALNEAHGKAMAHAAMLGGGGYAMLSAGRNATNSVLEPVKAYSQFEDAMGGVARQVQGARDANGQFTATYYEMGNAIRDMSKRIPMAATEIAALVEAGARMGIQGKDNLLGFAETTAKMGAAFDLPVDELGNNMAKVANLYKVPIDRIGEMGDTINWLDDNAQSQGGDIIGVLQRMAGVATSAGMSFKQAAALGSTFLSLGATEEVAGTASNAMIRELSIANMQPKRFQKGMGMLGLDSAKVQSGMATDATGTIQKVLGAIKQLKAEDQLTAATLLFGKEYGDDASKLANNLDEYRRQLALVNAEKAKGSMQRESDVNNQLLSKRWQMTQNRLFDSQTRAGETLKPVLIDLMNAASGLLDRFSTWIQANPVLAGGILKTVVGLTVLATVLGGGAVALAGFMAPFSILQFTMAKLVLNSAGTTKSMAELFPTFIKLGKGVRMLGVALFTTPLGWFLLAIAAIAGAAYLIYKNWEPIKAFFLDLWTEIKAGFSGGLTGILGLILNFSPLGMFYRAFAGVMNYFGFELPGKFTEFGANVIQGLINGFTSMFPNVASAIGGIADSTVGWFKEKLGIHSPSRVFAELGGFTMAGLEQGLLGGQGGPLAAVVGLGKQLAAAGAITLGMDSTAVAFDSRPPLAQPASARQVTVQGDTFEITIQGNGNDTASLRQMLNQLLDERERGKAARIRSALHDTE